MQVHTLLLATVVHLNMAKVQLVDLGYLICSQHQLTYFNKYNYNENKLK